MQCRHFTIRVSPQHLIEDEDRLNTFLRQVQVVSIQTSMAAPKGERWSVLVFFEEPPAQAGRRASGLDEVPPAVGPRAGMPGEAGPAADEGTPAASGLSAHEQRIYERLRAWRSERSRAEGVPPYVIAHNAALLHIARHHMSLAAAEDLAPIKKFGAQKAARYGPHILELLREREDDAGEALFDDDYAR